MQAVGNKSRLGVERVPYLVSPEGPRGHVHNMTHLLSVVETEPAK